MQVYADEAAFIQYRDEDESTVAEAQSRALLQSAKEAVFGVFLRVNGVRTHLAMHYHALMLMVEALQVMSLVMGGESYSKFGPYWDQSPWNLGQISWLIDVCWIFRVDRYLRFSLLSYLVLVGLVGGLLVVMLLLVVLLAVYKRPTSLSVTAVKVLKVTCTLLCDVLFVPIVDSLVFGAKCSVSDTSGCLGLQANYLLLMLFCALIAAVLIIATLCAMLYYDCCMFCGNITAKPHPRFKLLRLTTYTAIVFTYYFTTNTSGSAIIFLIVSLSCGALLSFSYMQYGPYYNYKVLRMRLATSVSFTCAAFCLLVGECFKTTDSTNSSVTMLFYFLTPCLVQITHLGILKRYKVVAGKPPQKLTNFLEVELKVRLLAQKVHEVNSYNPVSVAENDPHPEEQKKQRTALLTDIEKVFADGMKRFPACEWLYLWSGLLQLHLFENYVLAIVQCFKGMQLANRLDSQYVFFAFRFSSEAMYKGHMKDDAYEYVLYEKCLQSAQRNDEKVTTAQYRFWSELESVAPKIQKLNSLAGETSYMIGIAKSTYQQLIKLNSKNTTTLRMFGGFLTSLNNFSDVGLRYIQKADLEDEARNKNENSNVLDAATQPLSFFDTANAVMTVSADFDTIGEILKVNEAASQIFGYLKAEMEGRNVTMIIPQPFAENHDTYMARFHITGGKNVIDNTSLTVFFVHKMGYLIQGRILIKVVPNDKQPPYLMSVIKETKPSYEYLLLNEELGITGRSRNCDACLPLPSSQSETVAIQSYITNFAEFKAAVDTDVMVEAVTTDPSKRPKGCLKFIQLGDGRAYFLRIESAGSAAKLEPAANWDEGSAKPEGRAISTLQTIDSVPEPPAENSDKQDSTPSISEEESEELDGSASDASASEEEHTSQAIVDEPSSEVAEETPADPPERDIQQDQHPSVSSSSKSESEQEDYLQEGNDAHSAYSSSKSMNSSMASLAQFNKSIKALISYEFARTKRQVLRFKVSLILTIILLIVTSSVAFEVIGNSVEFNERLSALVEKVGRMRHFALSLAYYVRVVALMDAGFLRADNRSDYLRWMKEDISEMHTLNIDLHTHSDFLSSDDADFYDHSQFPSWHSATGQITETRSNLFTTAATLILQSALLHSDCQNSLLRLTDERAFYIYRNGQGELLSAINTSAGFYVQSAGSDLVKARLTAILLILTSVIVLLLCAGLAVIPTLKTLDTSRKEVWDIFLEMPPHICRVMKGKCNERLQLLNDAAHLELEEGQEENQDDEAKTSKKADENDSPSKVDRRAKRNKERRALARDIRVRKIVGAKLSCFFLMSVVYFYLIYFTGFQAVGSVLEEEPVTINWASRLRQLTRSVNFWLLESVLENSTSLSYKDIVANGQIVGSAPRAAATAVWELEYVENSLIFGNKEEGLSFSNIRSATHDELLFVSGCVTQRNRSLGDCETVGDKAMMQGLHSALDMYGTLARTILQQISQLSSSNLQAFSDSPPMRLLRELDDRYLYDSLSLSILMYKSDYRESQDQMKIWQRVLISVFSVCSMALFFLVYTPMIERLGQDTKQAWSMCTLIPQEYQEEFKRLNAVIRERRDNFVWR